MRPSDRYVLSDLDEVFVPILFLRAPLVLYRAGMLRQILIAPIASS